MTSSEDMESDDDYPIEDEAERLLKEIELMKKNVDNSKLYAGMRFDLERNDTFKQHLVRVLGSYSHIQVVIYALGSIGLNYHSLFQLAVILLLKRDFSDWIGNVQVYDPAMGPVDIIVFKELGLEVLTINENWKRQVQKPTMFYMPFPYYELISNLLGANWCSSSINQIFLLTNSFRDTLASSCDCNRKKMQRLERILDFTTEFDIKTSYEHMYTNVKVFSRFAWHFFDVDPNMDMKTSLPVTEVREYETDDAWYFAWMDEHRFVEKALWEDKQSNSTNEGLPIKKEYFTNERYAQIFGKHRWPICDSVPPPSDWIKLNIYGIGTEGDQPGRYSGIFQDETGMLLDRYSGIIHVEDNVIAGLEALRHGLIRCVEGRLNAQKLVVESDNVILVQYVNGRPEPNEMTMTRLKEIFDLLEHITCIVYHVYEEANEAAKLWALRDECSDSA